MERYEASKLSIDDDRVRGAWLGIHFIVPLIFAEGGSLETAYLADIYDHVGFLGDLHRQITTMPDGAKVRLRVSD